MALIERAHSEDDRLIVVFDEFQEILDLAPFIVLSPRTDWTMSVSGWTSTARTSGYCSAWHPKSPYRQANSVQALFTVLWNVCKKRDMSSIRLPTNWKTPFSENGFSVRYKYGKIMIINLLKESTTSELQNYKKNVTQICIIRYFSSKCFRFQK